MSDFAARRRQMVDSEIRPSDITDYPIIEAFLTVPREMFVPAARRELAYLGESLTLDGGRALPPPRVLGKMLEALSLEPSDLVLDIGCASGYSTAIIARLAEAVVGVECDESLAAEADALMTEIGADNAAIVAGELSAGAPRHAPFDAIILQGAVEALPETLTDQLAEGGRIAAIFAEGALHVCRIGRKHDGAVSWRFAFSSGAPVLPGFAQTPGFVF